MVGLQLSNFSAHWKAGKDASAVWMTAETVSGHMRRWQRQKWHTKMIFYPIIVLIVLTLIYNLGVYTLIIHFTGENGECPTGVFHGVGLMSEEGGNGVLLLGGFTLMFVGMLVFMSLLSVTHFKQYMRLHLFRLSNPIEVDGEEVDAVLGPNDGICRASFIRRTYIVTILAQGAILLALTVGKETTDEPNLLYAVLMFGIFLLGFQIGVGERHLHFDATVEPSAKDESLIRDRVEWHGSMMFYPCFVTIAQCFYNFSALFTLLPYFANDGRCSGTTIGDVFASINSAGWLVCVSNVRPAPRPAPGTCALCTRVEFLSDACVDRRCCSWSRWRRCSSSACCTLCSSSASKLSRTYSALHTPVLCSTMNYCHLPRGSQFHCRRAVLGVTSPKSTWNPGRSRPSPSLAAPPSTPIADRPPLSAP